MKKNQFNNRAGRRAQLAGHKSRGPKAFVPLRDTTGIYGNGKQKAFDCAVAASLNAQGAAR